MLVLMKDHGPLLSFHILKFKSFLVVFSNSFVHSNYTTFLLFTTAAQKRLSIFHLFTVSFKTINF